MSNKVQGKNVVASVKVDGVFFPIFCAKTANLVSVQEEVEYTDVNAGADRKFMPGMSSSTMDVTGVTTLDNTGSRVSIVYLMQAAQRRTTFEMRWLMTDDDGNNISIEFEAFSTTLSIDRALAGAYSQSAASFRISGGWTFSSIVSSPVEPVCEIMDPLYLTLAEGDVSVADSLLEVDDVVILGVARETDVYTEVPSSPGNQEFSFNGGAGSITFSALNPGNPGGENVWVLYKISP